MIQSLIKPKKCCLLFVLSRNTHRAIGTDRDRSGPNVVMRSLYASLWRDELYLLIGQARSHLLGDYSWAWRCLAQVARLPRCGAA